MTTRRVALHLNQISAVGEHIISLAGDDFEKVPGKTDIWVVGQKYSFILNEPFGSVMKALN